MVRPILRLRKPLYIFNKLYMRKFLPIFILVPVFFFFCYTRAMSIDTWGMLPKSGTDAQTIAEAIVEAVSAHNDDNTSHLDDGQSLQEHHSAEVIDHPAGSILADKISNTEMMFFFPFESFDNYDVSVTGVQKYLTGVRFDTSATSNTERYLRAHVGSGFAHVDSNLELTFQFRGSIAASGNYVAYGVAGGINVYEEAPGIGFKFQNGSLYAVENVFGDESFDEYTSAISDVDVSQNHIYRVQIDPVENLAYFFVDGVQKTSLELHTNADVGLMLFTFYVKNTTAFQTFFKVGGVYLGLPVGA